MRSKFDRTNTNRRLLFLTLYDIGAMGVRLLSALARERGFDPHIVFFKEGKVEKPIWHGKQDKDYTFFDDGILLGSTSQADQTSPLETRLLVDLIVALDPRLLCLSTRSFGLSLSGTLLQAIRKECPDLPVITGGWGPTTEPANFLRLSDYICRGEGEKAFCDILDRLDRNEPLDSVNNLAYYQDGDLKTNKLYPPLTPREMDNLPFPDYEGRNKYFITNNAVIPGSRYDQTSGYVCMASRGCPMSCSYCQSGQYQRLYAQMGYHCPKTRVRSVENVIDELQQAKRNGAHTIIMRDEVFPFQKEWVDGFARLYKTNIALPFFAYIRPEFHSPAMIKKLKEAGLYLTRIGIQSGSDHVLKNIYNRALKKEAAIGFAQLMEALDIQYSYHLLCHNPLEKEGDLAETLNFCRSLPYKSMRVFRLVVFPKSRLERLIAESEDVPLPEYVFDWYSLLYCMVVKNALFRSLANVIYKTRFLKRFPYLLQLLFITRYLRKQPS